MDARTNSPNMKIGRFLWMEEKEKKRYLAILRKKITEGFFSSDKILLQLVDEMAPAFSDSIEEDYSN